MSDSRKEGLSIIIPCLNEEKTIRICVERGLESLQRYNIPGEVLVVDNNSDDDSARVAKQAGARVVLEKRRGYGAAYAAGIRDARYACCLKADADGSYDLGEIDAFYKALQANEGDIVLGSRFKGTIKPGAMPLHHRYFGTPALTTLTNLIHRSKLTDINSGMRAFRTQTMLDLNLKCQGMEFASEMLIKALKKGLRIKEIPITLHKDLRDRKPHLKSFRDGWRHLRFILLMSPLELFFYPGAAFAGLGLVFSALLLTRDAFGGSHLAPIFGLTTFACMQNLLLLGFVLMIFSFITKQTLIRQGIDIPSGFMRRIEKALRLNRVLLICAAGFLANIFFSWFIIRKLYVHYVTNDFTPLYTKLGISNFTLYVLLFLLAFSAFFKTMFDDIE